jgi:DNA integrity scanning protein DisA with diadenylate cyclase activity
VIDPRAANIPDCPGLLTSLLTLESQLLTPGDSSVNLLIQLAVSMRAHRRGGALLVVPAGTASWRESILAPISYALQPPYTPFADLVSPSRDDWDQETLHHAIETVAGLTAVDGATLITDQYELLAFGAKIVRRKGSSVVNQLIFTEPVEGVKPVILESDQLGGARHLSAAQFTQDQRDAIALVASQDGRFTVFGWSPCDEMVRAHRIEALLL